MVNVHAAMKATSGSIVISRYAVGLPLTAFHVISAVMMKITGYSMRTSSSGTHTPTHVTNRYSSLAYWCRRSQKYTNTPAVYKKMMARMAMPARLYGVGRS